MIERCLADDVTALKNRHDEVHVIGSLDLVQSRLRFGSVPCHGTTVLRGARSADWRS